jgi:hypothetical protein
VEAALSRRQVLKVGAGGLVAVPFAAGAGSRPAFASPVSMLPRLPVYTAVWSKRADVRLLRTDQDEAALMSEVAVQAAAGQGVVWLTSYVGTGGTVRYSVVFGSGQARQQVRLGLDEAQLAGAAQGARIAALTARARGGAAVYDVVFEPGATPDLALGRTAAELEQWLAAEAAAGRRLAGLAGYGGGRYTAYTAAGTGRQEIRLGLSATELAAAHAGFTAAGLRLTRLSTHVAGGQARYSAGWTPGSVTQELTTALDGRALSVTAGAMQARGFQLAALVTDRVQTVDLDRVAAAMHAELDGRCVGWAAVVSAGGTARTVTQGSRRTAADAPASAASVTERVNIGDGTRGVTAIAAFQLLAARGLGTGDRIAPYLPSDWVRGPGIATLTFRDLLGEVGGLRGNAETYAALKAAVAAGVRPADRVWHTDEANYALFRVLIPYLDGFTEAGVPNKDTATSAAYLSYVNRRVLAPAGIATAGARPTGASPSLAYPTPAGATRGVNFGDWTGRVGSRGLHLSVRELTLLAAALTGGTALLDATARRAMFDARYGWAGWRFEVAHGEIRHTGDFLSAQTPGGLAATSTYGCAFTSGVQIAVTAHSPNDDGMALFIKAIQAHDAGWVTAT